MSEHSVEKKRPDYGLDAPGVIRNLFIAAGVGIGLWLTAAFALWSGRLVVPAGHLIFVFPLAGVCGFCGVCCGAMASWMVWSSKFGKTREREWLVGLIPWRGDERVLDVGCGRGLMLVAAAKRLTTGKATGIDIWQAADLSGNRRETALVNAELEGVANRVEIQTADMRKMPFPDATFDVVVSRAAIHNLYSVHDRAAAIGEIARVLKPGGQAIISDIRHHPEYVATFGEHQCTDVRWLGSRVMSVLLALLTMGALRPATLLVKKMA